MEQITVYDILSWADYTLIQDLGGVGGTLMSPIVANNLKFNEEKKKN